MPQRKRASSTLDGELRTPELDGEAHVTNPADMPARGADDAMALADEADAEAAAAEAEAAAARARAKALRLRRQAAESKAAESKAAESRVAEAKAAEATTSETSGTVPELDTADTAAPETDTVDAVPLATDAVAPETDYDATETVDTSEPEAAQPAVPRARRSRIALAAAILAVVLTLGFLGASGYMIVQHRRVVAEQQRSTEFAAAARQGVVTLMSLNFNSAQDDVKRILDNTTGEFKKDFAGQADEFAKVAQSSQVITEATVNATAVQSMSQDTATVLVAVTTQVSNAASKQQEPRSWRLRVDMARDGGQIKLAKVEFVP